MTLERYLRLALLLAAAGAVGAFLARHGRVPEAGMNGHRQELVDLEALAAHPGYS